MIKELQTVKYWVKLLTKSSAFQLHFWILQFLYVALSIPFPEYAKANYKAFKKSNGMSALFGILNSSFKELEPDGDLTSSDEEHSEVYAVKISNFTGIPENLNYFERNSMHICKGIVVINIIEYLMKLHKISNYVPLPSFLQYISKRRSVNALVQLLFIENQDLSKNVLNLFVKHFTCPFTLKNLYDN